jgi:hypothetical protein
MNIEPLSIYIANYDEPVPSNRCTLSKVKARHFSFLSNLTTER